MVEGLNILIGVYILSILVLFIILKISEVKQNANNNKREEKF